MLVAILALVAIVTATPSAETIRADLARSHDWATNEHAEKSSAMLQQIKDLLAKDQHGTALKHAQMLMAGRGQNGNVQARDLSPACQAALNPYAQQFATACPAESLTAFGNIFGSGSTPAQIQAAFSSFCTSCAPFMLQIIGVFTSGPCANEPEMEDAATAFASFQALSSLMCLQTATEPKRYCFPIVISTLSTLGSPLASMIPTSTLADACGTGCIQRVFVAINNLAGVADYSDLVKASVFLCLRDDVPYGGGPAVYCADELFAIYSLANNASVTYSQIFTRLCRTRCVQKYNLLAGQPLSANWQPACHRGNDGVPCAVKYYDYILAVEGAGGPNGACNADWDYEDLPMADSPCGAACANNTYELVNALGCCSTAFINVVTENATATAAVGEWMSNSCSINGQPVVLPASCPTGSTVSLSLTIYGLSSDYCLAAPNTAACRAAIISDLAVNLGVPESYLSDVTLNAPVARRRLLAPNTLVSYTVKADSTFGAQSLQADQTAAQQNGFVLASTAGLPAESKSDPFGMLGSSPVVLPPPATTTTTGAAGMTIPSVFAVVVAAVALLF